MTNTLLFAMNANPQTHPVYAPLVWPTIALSSMLAVVAWPVAAMIGHIDAFVIIGAGVFCIGGLAFVLSRRRKLGFIPLALPSPPFRTRLLLASLGLCWGAVLFLFLLGRVNLR